MTTPFGVAGELILSIAGSFAALALAAALAQRFLISAAWRRAIWQACILGMMLFAVLELAGARASWALWHSAGRPAARPSRATASDRPAQTAALAPKVANPELRRGPEEEQRPLAESAPNSESARLAPPALVVPNSASAESAMAGPAGQGKSGRWTRGLEVWMVRAWAAGCVLVLGWIGLSHGLFRRVRLGSVPVRDPKLCARVERARVTLGLPATLRVLMSPRFHGPIAFGILRRGVGLPCGFGAETETRQDVMLLHELAHLAARDPAWQLCADLTAALVWWHPAVWWTRRRLQFASETAADEASVLVADGPGALAECLVELGLRLRPPSTARLGISGSGAGFRSGLARRVERLTRLRGHAPSQPTLRTVRWARALGLAAALGALLLGVSWAFPQLSTQGTTMKSSKVPAFALAALLAETAASAAEPLQAPPAAPAAPPVLAVPVAPAPPVVPAPVRPTAVARYGAAPADPAAKPVAPPPPVDLPPPPPPGRPPVGGMTFGGGGGGAAGGFSRRTGDGGQALREKLEQIVLPDVAFDNLPLSQAVEFLRQESTKLDPAKVGVNFLFGNRRLGRPIDPATGLPAVNATEPESLQDLPVRIVPPLKRVRLVDVLEAITRVTPEPIHYVVEDYAVVFTFDPPPPSERQFGASAMPPPASGIAQAAPRLKVRAFKFKKSTGVNSMEVTFGITLDRNADLTEVLRQKMFPKVGLHLETDRVMLYNELTSTLLVRASDEELASVAAILEMLAGPPSPP